MSLSQEACRNRLLAVLPEEEYQRFGDRLERVSLIQGQIIYEWGEPIHSVYFPTQSLISLVSFDESGASSEVGVVCRTGIVGLPVIWGGDSTNNRAEVQIPGPALKLDARTLQTEFGRGGELQRQLLLYTQALMSQITQTALCNSHHLIEARLARWLLLAQDCVETNELQLTQDFISSMLGVRRPSISEAIGILTKLDIINTKRGRITIMDQQGLETRACECYRLVKDEYRRLLNTDSP